jgi:hypothetical protein
MINLQTDRPAVLTAICIRALNRINRIRRMQHLPPVDYNPLEVERLSEIANGYLGAKNRIIFLVTQQALLSRGNL